MSERTEIFAGEDPFAIARRWLGEARATEPSDPDAAALATVDANGLPNVRTVLVRAIEGGAFVFFTNYDSQKGQELKQGKAAMVFHWKSLGRQLRLRGLVERATPEASDAYYHARPLGSRIGAWASKQSRPLASRQELVAAVARAEREQGAAPRRPEWWGGFRLIPLEMEFWAEAEFRLHDRFRWRRETPTVNWEIQRLNP